jgi:CheY-like chemotaxis protein
LADSEGSPFCTGFLPDISGESLLERKPQETVLRGLASFVLPLLSMRNTNKKILIVDSDDRFRETLRAFITGLGHQVFEAATGLEAIDKACSIRPDLIMIDVRLPGMYGDEVTARLKANKSTRNIPVVINTGWTTACNIEERVDRALNAGAEEILYKPFQLPVLRHVLRTYLLA